MPKVCSIPMVTLVNIRFRFCFKYQINKIDSKELRPTQITKRDAPIIINSKYNIKALIIKQAH